MIIPIGLIISGILFILIPHFVLPLGYIRGASGAMLLSECSIWYHIEIYIGILIIIGGLLQLRYKKAVIITLLAALFGFLQSYLMRPVSFYIQSEEPLIILAQTYSVRAHEHIALSIVILSAIVFLLSIIPLFRRRLEVPVKLNILHISSTNLKRKRFRTLALIISLTIVIGAFFSDILLTRSIENTLELGAGRLGADLMVVPRGEEKRAEAVLLSGGPTMFYMNKEVMDKLALFPEIEKMSPQLYVQPFSYKTCCIVESILIIAYDPHTDFTVAPWIQYSLRQRQEDMDLVVGKLVKFYPGQSIDLFGKSLKVVASLEPTGLGYFDNSAFISMESARKLLKELKERDESEHIPSRQEIVDESFSHLFATDEVKRIPISEIDPEGISAVFIKTGSDVSIQDLTKKIEKIIEGVSVINVKESTISVKRHINSVLSAFLLPIFIVLCMGILSLGVIFSMSVNERLREIGLLRAVGAKRSDVFRLILFEALIISGIGGIFGILFGSALIFLFKNNIMAALELLYIWPSPRIIFTVFLLTIVTSLGTGLISGIYPAIRASRMEPYFAIRAGEK
jgi:putative ABC transport system permease protein